MTVIFGVSRKMFSEFKENLADFTIVGATVHFSPERPLPAAVLKKLVMARMEETKSFIIKNHDGRQRSR